MRRLTLALSLFVVGCLDPFSPDVGPPSIARCDPEDSNPGQDVSFADDIMPLLERRGSEGGCSCHMPSSSRPFGIELSGLNLGSHEELMRGGANSMEDIVVPGDPCISILTQKIGQAPPFGSRMPSSGPPYMTEVEQQLIHDWIAEGANAR